MIVKKYIFSKLEYFIAVDFKAKKVPRKKNSGLWALKKAGIKKKRDTLPTPDPLCLWFSFISILDYHIDHDTTRPCRRMCRDVVKLWEAVYSHFLLPLGTCYSLTTYLRCWRHVYIQGETQLNFLSSQSEKQILNFISKITHLSDNTYNILEISQFLN